MTKRIAVLAYTHFPSDGRPRREAKALADRGDEVHVWALGTDGDYELDGVSVHELPVRRYRGGSIRNYLRSYASFFAQAAIELARHPTPDVVHVHTLPDFMIFAALLPRLRGSRIVLDIHDPMPELYASKFGLGPYHPLIRVVAGQERAAIAFADHVICTHDAFAARLASLGVPRERVTVLLNAADPSVFGEPGELTDGLPPSDPPRIVYHGTIAERLGLDIALEAFDRVRRYHPKLRFQILGTGDFAPSLNSLIAARRLDDVIDFPDVHLPVQELPAAIKDATVGLVPNRSDPATRLMLPVKLLEYAHLGVPAVAPRLPAITQYFDEHRAALYDPENAASLAATLDALLKDPDKRAHVRERAIEFSKTIRWERARHDLYAAIDGTQLVSERRKLRVVRAQRGAS